MATKSGKANRAIQKVTSDYRAGAKEIIASNPAATDKDIKARLAKLRYEQTQFRGRRFRDKIQKVTPEQVAVARENMLVMTDTRGSPGQRMKRHFIQNNFIDFLINHEGIPEEQVWTHCPTAEEFISYARHGYAYQSPLKDLGLSKRHYIENLRTLYDIECQEHREFEPLIGKAEWTRVHIAVAELEDMKFLYTGTMFPRKWLQSMHVSFILQSYLLRCLKIGTTSWDRSIQDIAGIVVMIGTGCRTGEVLVSKDYDDEMTLKWHDTEIGFKDGIPDMEHAVVKVRLRHQKGFKGQLNQWRDVSQSTLAIEGMAHLDMGAIIMTYAMREGQVQGTLSEICEAAVKNKDRKIKWLRPNDPFMHRWADSNSTSPKPAYGSAMNTDGYLARFKIICETARYGDQVLHSLRRGSARDTKNAPTEAHHGIAKIAGTLGHSAFCRDSGLSEQYGLAESVDEYNARIAHAAKQDAPVFDYSGFLGDRGGSLEVSKIVDFPVGSKYAATASIKFEGPWTYPPHSPWRTSNRHVLRSAWKERGWTVGELNVTQLRERLEEDDIRYPLTPTTPTTPTKSAGEQLDDALSQFTTGGDKKLSDAEEDELNDMAYDVLGNTPDTLASHLADSTAFINYFSRINEVTLGGTTGYKSRTQARLKADTAHLVGNSRAPPSFYIYDRDVSIRYLYKEGVDQVKPTKPPAIVRAHVSAKQAMCRTAAAKRKAEGEPEGESASPAASTTSKVVLREPAKCRFPLCDSPVVFREWDKYVQHLRKSHGVPDEEIGKYLRGGTSHKNPKKVKLLRDWPDATKVTGDNEDGDFGANGEAVEAGEAGESRETGDTEQRD